MPTLAKRLIIAIS